MLGDDWEAEYDALSKGDRMYLEKLAGFLRHFPGRTSSHNLFLPGPAVADAERVWRAFGEALGIGDAPQVGDRARVAIDGLAPVDGVVDYVRRPTYVGVRAGDGMYTLMHGYRDTLVVEYHGFSGGVDASAIERAWQAWLAGFA
jgi:hypothetical protein